MSTISPSNVLQVDFGRDERPKYVVLEGAIRAAVERGDLPPGAKLPPVRDLAWRIGVTPGTVARAYTRLTDAGLLEAVVGRGTFVARKGGLEAIQAEPKPLAIDALPHGTGGAVHDVNMLSPHLPSVGQAELIRTLLSEIAADPPSGLMHYPVHRSEEPARTAAASYLASPELGPVAPDDVILTNGGQQAIALILQTVLAGRRPVVLLEELTYPGFRRMAETLRADVVTVAIDGEGVRPDALAAAARHGDAQILCTSPDAQNPTCRRASEGRRREVIAVARAANLQILEDDCYQMTASDAPSYRLLAPERTWHVSSVAKTISPALRLGFALPPPDRRLALRRTAEYNYFGLATPMSDLAAKLLVHPELPALRDAVRREVGRYMRNAAEILAGHDLTWREDIALLWLALPHGWRASAFCRAAEEVGVKLRAAEEYAEREANAPHAVRLAVNCGVTLDSFAAAVRRLRKLLDHPPEGIGV
ncbi:PLP-dependent aminotransferase family protein [uncultured Jannaschia sp.]|uniref:aminotransferase-like domain-containing protein n=1 Tax=uncultured Jannaschia sp. TaxID=293347 RepID=UPI00260A5D9C|nr:PLP-dependent aminotransferase family protein [uncultured Jannaschia sp.]